MFKKNHMVINASSEDAESFALDGDVSFGIHEHNGVEKISLNCWVDFVDFEDSEIVGGSEVYLLIRGIPLSVAEFGKKGNKFQSKQVSPERDDDAEVCALFFSCEFFHVSEIRVETLGRKRFQVFAKVQDITEESEEFDTELWIEGKIGDEACEFQYPE